MRIHDLSHGVTQVPHITQNHRIGRERNPSGVSFRAAPAATPRRTGTAVPVHIPLASSNCQCRGQTPRTTMAQQLTTPARTALAPTKRAQRIDLRRSVVVKPPLLQAGLSSSWAVASTSSSITPTLTTPGVGAEAVVGVAPVRVAVVAELGPALGTLRPIFFLWRRRTSTSYADAAPQVLFGRY